MGRAGNGCAIDSHIEAVDAERDPVARIVRTRGGGLQRHGEIERGGDRDVEIAVEVEAERRATLAERKLLDRVVGDREAGVVDEMVALGAEAKRGRGLR